MSGTSAFARSALATAIIASFGATAWGQTAPATADVAPEAQATAGPQAATGDPQTPPRKPSDPEANATATTEMQTITVTGSLRDALGTAQALKQFSPMIVDSIIAEDIGKLPDNSVADAIQRITGVQIAQGFQGETSTVVVRGLPNVVTTLNGNEITSGAGRAFAFQNLPATAVKAIKVYKTSDASLPDGGIAGLVDMELYQPFDFDGRKIAATFDESYSKYGGKTDPTGSLLLSDRWDTGIGEVGALINFSMITKHYDYNAVWNDFPTVLTQPMTDPTNPTGPPIREPIRTAAGNLISAPNAFGADYNFGYRKRPEVNYALQWRASEELQFYARGLYDWDSDNYSQPFFFSIPVGNVAPSSLTVTDHCYPNQNQNDPYYGQTVCDAAGGTWTGNYYSATSTQAHEQWGHDIQNSIGAKWDSSRLHLSTDLSQTLSSFHDQTFIIDTFLKAPLTTIWSGQQNWGFAGNPQLDPNNYYLNGLFQTWHTERGQEYAWRGDGVFDFNDGPLQNLQFGFRASDHKANYIGSFEISQPPPGGPGDPAGNPGVTPNPDNRVTNRFPSNFFCAMPTTPAIPNSWLTGCFDYLTGNADALRSFYGLPNGLLPENPGRFFDIDEKRYAGYVQIAYNTTLFGLPIDGLVGFRSEQVKRDLNAFSALTNPDNNTVSYTPLSVSTDKPTYLPNASAIVHFTDSLQGRLVAAKTVSYPGFGQLNPSLSLNPPTINRRGFAASGNADLKPTKSDNYDASLEWYFSPVGSLSAGAFYRDVTGYIQNYVTIVNIGGDDYDLSSPQSAGRGHLAGYEVAYQQTFDFLPGFWNGLGTQLNYTYIDGSTISPQFIGGPLVSTPLVNVSKDNYNAVLFYEKYGVSARLAYNYRSRYVDFFTQPTLAGVNDEIKPANQVDFSVGYSFNEWGTVVLSATNILGADLHQYWGDGNTRPRDIRYQDRTVGVGLRIKL